MKESVTYQAIWEEGEATGEARGEARGEAIGEARGTAKGERSLLLRIAGKKLGPPDGRHISALESITDTQILEALADRLLEVSTWDELLCHPA